MQKTSLQIMLPPSLTRRLIDNDSTLTEIRRTKLAGRDEQCDFFNALACNRVLHSIRLAQFRMCVDASRALAHSLALNQTLTFLRFSAVCIEPESMLIIARALQRNSTLRQLLLRHNSVCDDGARALARMLEQNSAIETLDLYANQLGKQAARALAHALACNRTLTTLNLRCNRIDKRGACHLARALAVNDTLLKLDLRDNCIGDYGARVLAHNLAQRNATLCELDLRFNHYRSGEGHPKTTPTWWCNRNAMIGQTRNAHARRVAVAYRLALRLRTGRTPHFIRNALLDAHNTGRLLIVKSL